MPGLIALCKKYFGETNLYAVLGISKNATDQQVYNESGCIDEEDIFEEAFDWISYWKAVFKPISEKDIMKKAYHKLSLKVHPDRVEESEKMVATEKFKVLGKIHSILSSKEKRAIYNESGCIDEEDIFEEAFDWISYWKAVFKPISEKDISEYEKKYKNSSEEAMDLKKAYLNGKGDMDFILESVPFTNCDEEPRLRKIIEGFIANGDVPEFDLFTNEPPRKTTRRKRKWALEAKKAEKMAASHDLSDATGEETLKLLIENRQRDRGEQMNNFFDELAAKYGGTGNKKSTPKTTAKKQRRN